MPIIDRLVKMNISAPDKKVCKLLPDELSEKQLEEVMGGMTQERFDLWRLEILNEDRCYSHES